MKIQNLLINTILAMSVTQAAIAQFEASSQAVTIALTGKYQEPGYEDVDGNPAEELSTIQEGPNGPTKEVLAKKINAKAYKVGNKEILQLALPDESISGWSIVYKDGEMLATKKNEEPITIDIDVSAFAEMTAFAVSEVTTTTTKYNSDGDPTATQTYAGSGTIEGPVTITYGESEMIGYVSGTYKSTTWYSDPSDKSSFESINIPGAVKITGLSGSQEGDYGDEVFTGSVNLAAAKANKVQ
jgi:hypothetical protein